MLTDTFHSRYAQKQIWQHYDEADRRLNVQLFRVVSEQLFPFYDTHGEIISAHKRSWEILESKLSLELGVENLSSVWPDTMSRGKFPVIDVCKNFMCAAYDPKKATPDSFMKERVSFIELALRERASENDRIEELSKQTLRQSIGTRQGGARIPSLTKAQLRARSREKTDELESAIEEVNARFRAAKKPLNYHNGYIQISTDELVEKEVEKPFWRLVGEAKWENVDTDMKVAMDLRDTGGKNPALSAAMALESTIKIISDDLGFSSGAEKGAANYIDNLVSANNGRFIDVWEADLMRSFFRSVRNPLGHGPGNKPMPKLSSHQTDWAIEFAMIWIKSLIGRLPEPGQTSP